MAASTKHPYRSKRIFLTISLDQLPAVSFLAAAFLVWVDCRIIFSPLNDTEISKLEEYNVIPNYLSMPPDSRMEIRYPSGSVVGFGNLINEERLKEIPKITWPANADEYFTLMMINPDRPNKEPLPVEYLQWLVVNIKGNNVSTGQAIFKYESPKALEPFPRIHMYVFLLYFQAEGIIHVDRSYAAAGKNITRETFNVRAYCQEHKLNEPAAVSFFRIYEIWTNPNKIEINKKGFYDRR